VRIISIHAHVYACVVVYARSSRDSMSQPPGGSHNSPSHATNQLPSDYCDDAANKPFWPSRTAGFLSQAETYSHQSRMSSHGPVIEEVRSKTVHPSEGQQEAPVVSGKWTYAASICLVEMDWSSLVQMDSLPARCSRRSSVPSNSQLWCS